MDALSKFVSIVEAPFDGNFIIEDLFGKITTSFVNLKVQLVDIFTRSLRSMIIHICSKLDAYDIYEQT